MNTTSIEHLQSVVEQARSEWGKGGQQKQPWRELEAELKALCAQGWGVARLAKRYNVSTPTIRKWLRRLSLKTCWQQLREQQ